MQIIKSFLMCAMMLLMLAVSALAATPNPSPNSPGYELLTFSINKQYTATTAGVVRFKMPWPAKLVTVQATARASGGTSPTLTVDVKEAAVSKFTTPIAITAGTVSEGVIGTIPRIADEALITVDLTIGGTTPTWDDITVVMVVKRL